MADVVGLTRGDHVRLSPQEVELQTMEWRRVDLFSLLECELALKGCTHAYYLVHSMMPSARLTQASFDDLDLLLADNFARAAKAAGVQRIIYLGGILPDGDVSDHLRSRREVEEALESTGIPVVSVRAGLVLGPGGSSTEIVTKLVDRLPVMACPSWTGTQSNPIDLEDLVPLLVALLEAKDAPSVVDVGGTEIVSYRELMRRTASVLGVRRSFLSIPLFTPGLSTLWVSLITGSSRALVRPLVQSLKHPMLPKRNEWQQNNQPPQVPLDESLARAALTEQSPRSISLATKQLQVRLALPRNTVRSVQRLVNPVGLQASEVARKYIEWLPRFFRSFVRVERADNQICFSLLGWRPFLLILEPVIERSESSRALFYVQGGALARPNKSLRARLEFREVLDDGTLLAAIHDFVPRLPWFVYNLTQAIGHLWVMRSFGKYLRENPAPAQKPLSPPP